MPLSVLSPSEILYEGAFTGLVGPDHAEVRGQARVMIGTDGLPDISVIIPAGSRSSEALDKAYAPDGAFVSTSRVTWQSASIETAAGVFRVTDRPFLRERNLTIGAATPQPQILRLGALRAEFQSTDARIARYWALPLYNLLWDARPRAYRELAGHPLWFQHNQQKAIAAIDGGRLPPAVIAFLFDGTPAFVQRVADYEDLKQQLKTGALRRAVTAVMVGEVGNRSFSFPPNAPESWFPMHLLLWLSMATGGRIGAPWIELLDSSGNLVRRIHLSFGHPNFRAGLARIDDVTDPGSIGHTLTKVLNLEHFGRAHTSIPLLLLVECISHGGSLEYRKIQLVRAFECLARHFGLADVVLADSLQPSAQSQARSILEGAWSQLRTIAKPLPAAERTLLERIADRARAAGGKEKHFGLKVQSLAESFAFSDSEVLDRHFKTNPAARHSTWAGALSWFRGAVTHEGYFALDISGGEYPLRETGAVIDHLEDLLTRILLSLIGYEGRYRSTIRGSLTPVPLNWVHPSVDVAELGFNIDYSV